MSRAIGLSGVRVYMVCMRHILAMTVLALGVVSCNQDPPIDSRVRPNQFAIEFLPTLSADSAFVYAISLDTIRPEQSGLFRARTVTPIREQIQVDMTPDWATVQALTVSPSRNRLAVLQGGQLWLCQLAGDSACQSVSIDDYTTAEFIADSVMLLGRDSSLYLAGTDGSNPTFLTYGYEPSYEGNRQFIAVRRNAAGSWQFVLVDLDGSVDTLYTLADGARPRWPDIDMARQWLAFTRPVGDLFAVQTVRLTNTTAYTVATSRYPRVCLAEFNVLLFTGPTGLLYHVSFTGGQGLPWIHVEEGEE